MLLPNPPWYRRWSVILAGIIGLAAITALLGWRGLQQVASPATTGPTTTATTATTLSETTSTQPQPIRQPGTTVERGVLWKKTGSDVLKSPGFTAPERWRILWSFDCSNFKRYGGGNFKITGDGALARVQIQEFDTVASGSRSVTGGGFGHLTVDSVCKRWTVQAVEG